jgi:hydroxymethylglutaryl-CoA lyase
MEDTFKIIECPRDAMQGIKTFIPTEKKITYIQHLLSVGFDTIDFGSFVSPRAIPQMADTGEVIKNLDISNTNTKLLAIVANSRGAEEALKHDKISYLGYPLSISEYFQMRNVGKSIAASKEILREIVRLAKNKDKEVVGYISMGFGNPYGDPWSEKLVEEWTVKLINMGIKIISLSDTVGTAEPEVIFQLFSKLVSKYPHIEFGAHLHTHPANWYEKMEAAHRGGCRRFDGAIMGYGGCPMAKDDLTGNMPTEKILSYLSQHNISHKINTMRFESAYNKAIEVFNL